MMQTVECHKKFQYIFAIITIFVLVATTLHAGDLMVLTENSPPGSYRNDSGGLDGYAVDITKEILKRTNNDSKIIIMPWKRAYHFLSTKPNIALFQTIYTPERADKFLWCGPLSVVKFSLYRSKLTVIDIPTIEAAKKLTIGTYAHDVREDILKKAGFNPSNFTHLFGSRTHSKNLALLLTGKTGLWITSHSTALETAEKLINNCKVPELCDRIKNKTSGDIIEPLFELDNYFQYIAFSKGTSLETVRKWQQTLEEIKQDGTYEKFMKKHKYGESRITFEKYPKN